MKKLNIPALIAFIIGLGYLIYSFSYWGGVINDASSASDAGQAGAAIATVLVLPHVAFTGLAVVFNALGCFLKRRGFVLVGGILYTIAIVVFPAYFMFVIIEMILSFVGYSQMKKQDSVMTV